MKSQRDLCLSSPFARVEQEINEKSVHHDNDRRKGVRWKRTCVTSACRFAFVLTASFTSVLIHLQWTIVWFPNEEEKERERERQIVKRKRKKKVKWRQTMMMIIIMSSQERFVEDHLTAHIILSQLSWYFFCLGHLHWSMSWSNWSFPPVGYYSASLFLRAFDTQSALLDEHRVQTLT